MDLEACGFNLPNPVVQRGIRPKPFVPQMADMPQGCHLGGLADVPRASIRR
jgi:hypothetical protein